MAALYVSSVKEPEQIQYWESSATLSSRLPVPTWRFILVLCAALLLSFVATKGQKEGYGGTGLKSEVNRYQSPVVRPSQAPTYIRPAV